MIMDHKALNKLLGNIDLFLLDQILKGRFDAKMKILDAGCGEGRNLHYFFREGYDVYAVDKDRGALRMLNYVAQTLKIGQVEERFVEARIQNLPFPERSFDAVLCISVLHFAKNDEQLFRMVLELNRVLKSGGILLIGMLTDIGITREVLMDGPASGTDDFIPLLLSNNHYKSILDLKMFESVENIRIHSEPGVQNMGYFVLKKVRGNDGIVLPDPVSNSPFS